MCKNTKEHHSCNREYISYPTKCSCENIKYLASTIDDSGITCDEAINAGGSVSANVPTIVMITVSINAMSTASKNFHKPKVRYKMDCYILHLVLLVVI